MPGQTHYETFACYARTFLDLIWPSNVAYVISLLKNERGLWDMVIEMRERARSGEIRTDAKARPLFTGGKGKKRNWGRTCGRRKVLSIIIQGRRIGENYTRMKHS